MLPEHGGGDSAAALYNSMSSRAGTDFDTGGDDRRMSPAGLRIKEGGRACEPGTEKIGTLLP
ncbi:hypothetical protein SDC9_54932 [bioreactor metagenome]|uniref:Uncharacterized protein n=1 Tax=bioreactor metagenome TaxID=1076179 RepID=A0A644WYS0_9ZZZZ